MEAKDLSSQIVDKVQWEGSNLLAKCKHENRVNIIHSNSNTHKKCTYEPIVVRFSKLSSVLKQIVFPRGGTFSIIPPTPAITHFYFLGVDVLVRLL